MSNNEDLRKLASKTRLGALELIYNSKLGHPGGSLSLVEILTCLYFAIMSIKPNEPEWEERDRLILSKGHASSVLYTVLAQKGYFDKKLLPEYGQLDGRLSGHPDMTKVPGVDFSSGSLGQGLSVGLGMAIGANLRGLDFKVFVILGDGELQEGQNWEALIFAGQNRLSNLIAIVDFNGLQQTRSTNEVMNISALSNIVSSFGWNVIEVDGHDLPLLERTLREAVAFSEGPTFIIARTVKGKGVSFMENQIDWHVREISESEMLRIRQELSEDTL